MRCQLLATLLVTTVSGCTQDPQLGPLAAKSFGRAQGFKDVLVGATKVEVYRIDGGTTERMAKRVGPGEPNIDGYAIIDRGKDQTAEFVAALDGVLLDKRTYTEHFVKCYNPGVVFRFCKGDDRVDVVICFHCGNFYIGPPVTGEQVLENAAFHGSPNRARLVRLAKQALPDDKDIQALE
jgi:hypothetical protein